MSSKHHTPGPWFLRLSLHNVTGATITTQSGSVIATARNQDDARLIAAAPDLLTALEFVAKLMHSDTTTKGKADYSVVRDAIAAARGEG
jgi:hypothetical protein